MRRADPFRWGHMCAASHRTEDVTAFAAGRFDVGILTPSWDRRCICPAGSNGTALGLGILVGLSEKDHNGLQERHSQLLHTFLADCSKRVVVCESASPDLASLWSRLYPLLFEERLRHGRALEVLIEASTCPRYITLAVLGVCLRQGIARRVSVLYSEGRYPDKAGETKLPFTVGRWGTIAVPGLEGEHDPTKRRLYVVSVGFEGDKTLRAVTTGDPDDLIVLFPDPGFRPEYPARTRTANARLFDLFRVEKERVCPVEAGDAVAAWRDLTGYLEPHVDSMNVFGLCCGTKPHSIGLALHAMATGTPTVLYVVPESHGVVEVEPTGVYWRYDVANTSVPPDRLETQQHSE